MLSIIICYFGAEVAGSAFADLVVFDDDSRETLFNLTWPPFTLAAVNTVECHKGLYDVRLAWELLIVASIVETKVDRMELLCSSDPTMYYSLLNILIELHPRINNTHHIETEQGVLQIGKGIISCSENA